MSNSKDWTSIFYALIYVTLFTITPDALAQDWVDRSTDIFEDILTGGQVIGGVLVAVGLVWFGIIGAVTGQLNFQRMLQCGIAGIIITLASSIAKIFTET